MSRWTKQFESHAFQATWADLKLTLEKATVDDETVVTQVEEIARLRKITAYLDETIQGIDPEIVPASTWDNYNSQAAPCKDQIDNYNVNRNIGHITNANAHADNLLTYVRPYMVADGQAVIAMREAAKAHTEFINSYLASFPERSNVLLGEIEAHKENSEELIDYIKSVNEAVEEFDGYLFGDSGEELGVKDQVEDLVGDLEVKCQSINKFHQETFVGDAETDSTKKEISRAKEIAFKQQQEIEELLGMASEELKGLEKFYNKIFGELNENKERNGGLEQELDAQIKALSDFERNHIVKYKALNDEIESLMPGATNAGLGTAYKELKDSFDAPIKKSSYIYYGSLVFLAIGSILLSIDTVSEAGIVFC